MKALVTGAGGFAGTHLAEYLLHQGTKVSALVRPDEDLTQLRPILGDLHVIRADIRDASRLNQVLEDCKPERIYHLAALTSPADSLQNPRLTYEVNFMGTLNLLESVRQGSFECRILLVSSSEVYGTVSDADLPLREETALHPTNPYAVSKAAGEMLACQFVRNYGMKVVRVRPFNHTGPRQSNAFVCSALARQVAAIDLKMQEPAIRVGDPAVVRDFTDVRDIVRGYHMLLEKGEAGEVYQLCSAHPTSIETVLQILTGFATCPIHVVVDPPRAHAAGAQAIWGRADKAREAVGWIPQYSLQSTLQDLKGYWEGALRSTLDVKP